MDSDFTRYLNSLKTVDEVMNAMRQRRADILAAIEASPLNATRQVVMELAELNVALGEATIEDGQQ